METVDEVDLLTSSPNRLAVLRAIDADESITVRGLADELGTTRRTVSRTLATLEEAGYILRHTPRGYRLTAKGAYLLESFDEFEDDVEVVSHVEPFLATVPDDEFDLDPMHLSSADVVVASEVSPYALVDRALDLRGDASTVREMSPAIERKSVGQLAGRLGGGSDVDVEIVTSPSALEVARTNDDYAPDHEVVRRSSSVRLFVHPDPFDHYLGIFDLTTAIAVSKDDRPYAMVIDETAPVREWATETFERYREEATPVEAYEPAD